MLPPPDSEEAATERAKLGALSYLSMRSIEDQALAGVAKEGQRVPMLATEGLREIGIALPTDWQEVTEALENLPVTAEVYALAYRLDREVRLFWEMVENIRGSIVRNCEAGKIRTVARAQAGGELTELPAHIWSMQFWDPRFDSGAIDLLKPFPRRPDYIEFHHDPVKKKWTRLHIGAEERNRATRDLHWVFFESASFAESYGKDAEGRSPLYRAASAPPLISSFGKEQSNPQSGNSSGRQSNMRLAENEMRRRAASGELARTLKEESEHLSDHIRRQYPGDPPAPKTIQNQLGSLYRELSKSNLPK